MGTPARRQSNAIEKLMPIRKSNTMATLTQLADIASKNESKTVAVESFAKRKIAQWEPTQAEPVPVCNPDVASGSRQKRKEPSNPAAPTTKRSKRASKRVERENKTKQNEERQLQIG